MSNAENVHQLFKPDADAMRRHLDHLFGGFLDGYHDGLIELAWTDTIPDAKGRYKLSHAKMFGTDEIDELIGTAVAMNSRRNCNVYVGAALRKPNTPPNKRSEDGDAWCLTAVYTDLDDDGATAHAKSVYGDSRPTFVCVTGREPHTRAQLWWRLDEPMTDPHEWGALVRGIVTKTKGDLQVVNPGRVMRLAGTIAWPVKAGRTAIELTSIALENTSAVYNVEQIKALFPPIMEASKEEIRTSGATYTADGLFNFRVADGRESYMVSTVAAVLLEYIGTNGTEPTAQELFDLGWPQYERKVDLSRPGRGKDEFAEKCEYAIKRFKAGKIKGMRDLDEAVATYKAKAERDRAKWEQRGQQERQEQAKASEERAASGDNLLISAADFISRFKPPEYLIDKVLQRGYLYSMTARTGHGKTAVAMYLAQCIARGEKVQTLEVLKGSVLFCAGENPDDIRARFIVLAHKNGFDPSTVAIHFIDGIVDIKASMDRIKREADAIADLVLIIVDTAAAYFKGEDINDNKQMGDFARDLRTLTTQIKTRPAVLVACHPVKNAAKDNMSPMGGSAFLNEVDGNLTLWKSGEDVTELHWQGKFRGPEFEPMSFKMETVTSDEVRDGKGRHMPSVVAYPVGELEAALAEATAERDDHIVLAIIAANKGLSLMDIAKKANWYTADGRPKKSKAQRVVDRLYACKFARRNGSAGKPKITKAGKIEIGLIEEKDDEKAEF